MGRSRSLRNAGSLVGLYANLEFIQPRLNHAHGLVASRDVSLREARWPSSEGIGLIVAGPPTTSDRRIIARLDWKGDPEASITMRSNMMRARRHARVGVSAQAWPRPGVSNSSRSTPPHRPEIPVRQDGNNMAGEPESSPSHHTPFCEQPLDIWRFRSGRMESETLNFLLTMKGKHAGVMGTGPPRTSVQQVFDVETLNCACQCCQGPGRGEGPGIHAGPWPVPERSATESEGLSRVGKWRRRELWGSCTWQVA